MMRSDQFAILRQRPGKSSAGGGAVRAGAQAADATRGLMNGLLSWWACHEGSGSSRADATATGNSLAETGGSVGSAAGLIGVAASLVKTNRLVAPSPPFASGPLSIACWVNPIDLATYGLAGQNASFTAGIGLTMTATTVNFRTSSNPNVASWSGALAAGSWSHVCGTYDGSTARLFVNGVCQATKASPAVNYANASAFGVGGLASASTNVFNGLLQLAGVWTRALTDGGVAVGQSAIAGSDVALLYNGGLGFDPTS